MSCAKILPYTSAAGRVANLMRLNRISIFSVDWTITSGSSCIMPLHRSVFSSCSVEPIVCRWQFGWPVIFFFFEYFRKCSETCTKSHTNDTVPMYMHVANSFRASNENCSFSIFTRSSASRSTLSWQNLVIVLVSTIRSKPCMMHEYKITFVVFFSTLLAAMIVLVFKLHSVTYLDVISIR